MTAVPVNLKIYHITHVYNLAAIASSGELISDAIRIANGVNCSLVGMSSIKQRRLQNMRVTIHPGTNVGEYVPFYFCPRSIMLYILHKGNHPELTYSGGQQPIIHLQADLNDVIKWADAQSIQWAFSNGNAGAYLTQFYGQRADLNQIDWTAVSARYFTDPQIKERKQSEFLTFGSFPWALIRKIGTINNIVATQVEGILASYPHKPVIEVKRDWYY